MVVPGATSYSEATRPGSLGWLREVVSEDRDTVFLWSLSKALPVSFR